MVVYQHDATNTICWTIHRPLRGWYIRIRSPMFPPGVFIPLTPVPSSAPYHTEAAMSFNSRTNTPVTITPRQLSNGAELSQSQDSDAAPSSSCVHSYPPPPATVTPSHSPDILRRPVSHFPASQITQFILAPSSSTPSDADSSDSSFFSRALSVIKSLRPARSNSFTLSRVLHPPKRDGVSSPPPPYRSNASVSSVEQVPVSLPALPETATALGHFQQSQPVLNTSLLVFHDQTPLLTLRSLTGLIELNQIEEQTLGVDTSFWIAIALTYLEFLEEREVSVLQAYYCSKIRTASILLVLPGRNQRLMDTCNGIRKHVDTVSFFS